MQGKFEKITLRLFAVILVIFSTLIIVPIEEAYASDSNESILIKKVSK